MSQMSSATVAPFHARATGPYGASFCLQNPVVYIRIDIVQEVPLDVLCEVISSGGFRLMHQEGSFDNLVNIVKDFETQDTTCANCIKSRTSMEYFSNSNWLAQASGHYFKLIWWYVVCLLGH